MQPVQSDNREALSPKYVECHRRIQALKTQGEDKRLLVRFSHKSTARFQADILRRWLHHAEREGISESNIT